MFLYLIKMTQLIKTPIAKIGLPRLLNMYMMLYVIIQSLLVKTALCIKYPVYLAERKPSGLKDRLNKHTDEWSKTKCGAIGNKMEWNC